MYSVSRQGKVVTLIHAGVRYVRRCKSPRQAKDVVRLCQKRNNKDGLMLPILSRFKQA